MAVGTTADFQIKRNELILSAIRKLVRLPEDELLSYLQRDAAVRALNLIIRQEDQRGTDQALNLWALSDASLFLRSGGHIYGVAQGLKNNIRDVVSASYRDRNGSGYPLTITDARGWAKMADHKDRGDPETLYFKRDRLLANQQFLINRAPNGDLGTPQVIEGTDTNAYTCILKHTSSPETQPITGASWPLYWQAGGSAPGTWADETEYLSGAQIFYTYKRPLFDFDLPTDNPDVPSGWEPYLIYRLALELAPEYDASAEKVNLIRTGLVEAREMLFPSARSGSDDWHNKTVYF